MPRVDFYVLSGQATPDRALLACRLAEKAYQSGKTAYLWAADEIQAGMLDDRLWLFRQDSFVPHERYPLLPGSEGSPILIGSAPPETVQAAVLINVTDSMPAHFEHFERVIELVDQAPETLARSRVHFKAYRALGYEPNTQKLGR